MPPNGVTAPQTGQKEEARESLDKWLARDMQKRTYKGVMINEILFALRRNELLDWFKALGGPLQIETEEFSNPPIEIVERVGLYLQETGEDLTRAQFHLVRLFSHLREEGEAVANLVATEGFAGGESSLQEYQTFLLRLMSGENRTVLKRWYLEDGAAVYSNDRFDIVGDLLLAVGLITLEQHLEGQLKRARAQIDHWQGRESILKAGLEDARRNS